MNPSLDLVPSFSAYHPALIALGLLSLMVLVQALLTAPLSFVTGEQEPGMPLKGTHADRSFRVLRTHANSVESLPAFLGAVLVAVIAGVDAAWVNWLAGLHVGFRLMFWLVYYAGVGKIAGGPRTMAFLGGWLTNAILAGMAVFSLV